MTSQAGAQISAQTIVRAPAEQVFDFLSDLDNHWVLADRFVRIVRLRRRTARPDGGRVRIFGPLGMHRTARTRILAAERPRLLIGAAEIGRTTSAQMPWQLRPGDGGTLVTLSTTIDRVSTIDRVLLGLGGTRWLRRRFAATVERLADHLDPG